MKSKRRVFLRFWRNAEGACPSPGSHGEGFNSGRLSRDTAEPRTIRRSEGFEKRQYTSSRTERSERVDVLGSWEIGWIPSKEWRLLEYPRVQRGCLCVGTRNRNGGLHEGKGNEEVGSGQQGEHRLRLDIATIIIANGSVLPCPVIRRVDEDYIDDGVDSISTPWSRATNDYQISLPGEMV